MTVSNITRSIRAVGNGITTEFSFPFPVFNETDIKVYKIDTTTTPETQGDALVLNTDYTVSLDTVSEGGTITYTVAPTSDEDSFIIRDVDYTQGSDFVANESFDEEAVEDGLDKLTMLAIQNQETLERSISVNEAYEGSADFTLPTPEASKVIGWNSTGLEMANYSGSDLDTILTTSFGQTLVQSANALGARGALELDTTDNVEFAQITGTQITGSSYVGLPEATTTIEGVTVLDKYFIYGLIPSSNAVTPDEQVDVTAGKCVAQDGSTILSFSADTADLTNHITPSVDTTYHLFVYRDTNGDDIVDFSTSLTPTVGTGDANLPDLDGTKYRLIMSYKTDSSGDLIQHTGHNKGDKGILIKYNTRVTDVATTTSSYVNKTFTIPTGIEKFPIWAIKQATDSSGGQVYAKPDGIEALLSDATSSASVLGIMRFLPELAITTDNMDMKETDNKNIDMYTYGYVLYRNQY